MESSLQPIPSLEHPLFPFLLLTLVHRYLLTKIILCNPQPKDTIQDTTCDNGSCTPDIAALWANTLTYGFGYRCDSIDTNLCDQQLSTSNYFKPYPSEALNQSATAVLTTLTKKSQNTGTVTEKVNISGTQKTVSYNNSITYLAIPNF